MPSGQQNGDRSSKPQAGQDFGNLKKIYDFLQRAFPNSFGKGKATNLMNTNFTKRTRRIFLPALLLCVACSAWAQSPNVSVFATGLKFPRGLKFGPDGNLYVAEAGAGGTTSTNGSCDQVVPPVGPYTGGFTARISMITPAGARTTVADNLPSTLAAVGDVDGISDVFFMGGTLYVLTAGAGCSHGHATVDNGVFRVSA